MGLAMFPEQNTGTFRPSEISIVQSVFNRIIASDRISQDHDDQNDLAKYVLHAYENGMHDEQELFEHCKAIAETRFSRDAEPRTD
jgi:hypothetical protein